MINFIQEGDVLEYSNAGSAIESGDVVVVGNRVGVAIADISASTGKGSLRMKGVHYLAKTTSQAWTIGDTLFWDTSTLKLTNVPTANTKLAGYAFIAAGAADTYGYCNIGDSYNTVASEAAVATADGSDAATTQALANALKTSFNSLLVKMKASGTMDT